MKKQLQKSFLLVSLAVLGFNTMVNAQWTQLTSPLAGTPVTSFAAIGSNLFAATAVSFKGVYLSVNGGTTWSQVNNGFGANPAVSSLTVKGTDLYAVRGGSYGPVYKTSDNGATWTLVNSTYPIQYSTSIISLGRYLFVTITGGAGVYRSGDDGTTWTQVGSGVASGGPLLVSGATIYANRSVSSDSGATWTSIAAPTGTPSGPTAISNASFFIGDSGAHGIFKRTLGTTTWMEDTVGIGLKSVYAMASTSTEIYIGTYMQGIYKSSDDGATWAPDNVGIGAFDVTANAFGVTANNIYYGASNGSVYTKSILNGINEIHNELEIAVYPNPNDGSFVIKSTAEGIYTITNELGQPVEKVKLNSLNNFTANVSDLKNGVYFIAYIEKNSVIRKKVIVAK